MAVVFQGGDGGYLVRHHRGTTLVLLQLEIQTISSPGNCRNEIEIDIC